jgi:hypothetical protein
MSPGEKTYNQRDHVLTDSRRHSSVLNVLSFRASGSHTGYYVVMVKVRERLAVNKQRSHRFHMERLSEVKGKEQYPVEV